VSNSLFEKRDKTLKDHCGNNLHHGSLMNVVCYELVL